MGFEPTSPIGISTLYKSYRSIPLLVSSVALLCSLSCSTRTREQEFEATEKVMHELGMVAAPASAIGLPVPPSSASEGKSDTERSATTEDSQSTPSEFADLTPPKPKPTFTTENPSEPWTTAEKLPQDIWEVQYLGNTPVGFMRRTTEVSKSQGHKVFRIQAESRMRVSSQGKSLQQHLNVMTIERDNGELITMEVEIDVGGVKQSYQGTVRDNLLRIIGPNISETHEWHSDDRGPFAIYQSLLRRPLKPFETRTINYFDPILRKVVRGKLEADDFIITPTLLGDSRELLEVRNTGSVGETSMNGLMWIDAQGEGYKSYMQSVDIRSFRTDPSAAQLVAKMVELTNITPVTIPITGPVEELLDGANLKSSISYRLTHRTLDPFSVFSDQVSQRLKSIDARTLEVNVYRVESNADAIDAVLAEGAVDEGTKTASAFIPCKDPLVQKLATALLATSKDLTDSNASPLEKAIVCRTGLYKRIGLTEFDNQIGTVALTLRNKKADCVEHAILFASVCRALNIPSRIALGYIFNRSQTNPEMKFHAWIEVRDLHRWVPMDSADQAFPTSVDRIKVLDSDFNGPNPYTEIVKVMRLVPDLEIKIVPQP